MNIRLAGVVLAMLEVMCVSASAGNDYKVLWVSSSETSELLLEVEEATGKPWTELIKEFGVISGPKCVFRCEPERIVIEGDDRFVSGAGFIVVGIWQHQASITSDDLAAFFDRAVAKTEKERFLRRIGIWLEWDENER